MSASRATRFVAVQLQDVGLQRLDDTFERGVVGIDGQRDLNARGA